MISVEFGALMAFVLNLIMGAVGYGKLLGRIDDLADKVKKLQDWQDEHGRDAQTQRSIYETRLTSFEVRLGRGEEKFEQIARDMVEIKSDLKTLLSRRREDREQ